MVETSTLYSAVTLYALCSSTLLVLNKLVLLAIPAPCFVLAIQLLTSWAIVATLKQAGKLKDCIGISAKSAVQYIPIALGFLTLLYSNAKVLQYTNVETFIVVRCSTPVFISILDYIFLQRERPCRRSWLSIFLTLAFSTLYMRMTSRFEVRGYFWILAWYILFAFDMIYIKAYVDKSSLSTWDHVLHTNFVAALFFLPLAAVEHSYQAWAPQPVGWWYLAISSVFGFGMSFASFWLRGMVSALTFTIIGIGCKIGSVLLSLAVWKRNKAGWPTMLLVMVIVASSLYRQSAKRSRDHPHVKADVAVFAAAALGAMLLVRFIASLNFE